MLSPRLLILVVALTAAQAADPPRAFPAESPLGRGEWPTYRGHASQLGRAARPGSPGPLAVRSSWFVGVRRVLADVRLERQGNGLQAGDSADFAPRYTAEHADAWRSDIRLWDLAGDGQLTAITDRSNVRFARFLPDAKGVQKFVMEDGMGVKNRPDGPRRPVARGSLYRYDRDKEELVWQTEPQEQCEIPLCAVTDVDRDGQLDIAVSTWWRVMVFDGRTGEKKDECRWHNGRNYGHFQMTDLDGDGYPEAVVMADFMVHHNVLRNRAGKLEVAWRHEIDFKVFGKQRVYRALPEAVVRRAGAPPAVIANLLDGAR